MRMEIATFFCALFDFFFWKNGSEEKKLYICSAFYPIN